MTPRRHVARLTRTAATVAALAWLGVVASWNDCAAQVGHPPDRSPFRDLKIGGSFVFSFGYLGGSRGMVGVGPSDGNVFGIRYERPLGRNLVAILGAAGALTTRYIVDPTKDSASRTSGPVDNTVALIDAGLHLRLMGGKTWHGFAPEIGVSAGVAYAGPVPGDPSQYDFKAKLTLGPEAELRWYPARRLSLHAGAELLYWRLSYPLEYRVPPTQCTTGCNPVLSLDDNLKQWTSHPWINLAVGWTF